MAEPSPMSRTRAHAFLVREHLCVDGKVAAEVDGTARFADEIGGYFTVLRLRANWSTIDVRR